MWNTVSHTSVCVRVCVCVCVQEATKHDCAFTDAKQLFVKEGII